MRESQSPRREIITRGFIPEIVTLISMLIVLVRVDERWVAFVAGFTTACVIINMFDNVRQWRRA